MKVMMFPAMSLPRKGIALPNTSCRMMPSASRAIPISVRRRTTILPRSNHSMSISVSFLLWRGYAWLFAVEQVENDGDRHQSHDAVAAQRRQELEQVADDIAAQERHGSAEQHLQHDGERHQQKAQFRDLEDPGFGLVEHLHHLLFLRCSGIGEVPLHSIVERLNAEACATTRGGRVWDTRRPDRGQGKCPRLHCNIIAGN